MPQIIFFASVGAAAYFGYRTFVREAERVTAKVRRTEQQAANGANGTLVKERRGSKLKDDPDLFTGLFWTGKKGLELGLVDALSDMRTVLKTRFGAKTQLRLVTAPRGLFGRIGLFGSSFSAPDIAAAAASGVIDAAEERALWARFGL